MAAESQPEPPGGNAGSQQTQSSAGEPAKAQAPPLWAAFFLFVLGFTILAVESKFKLPDAADYAIKGLGGGLCLITVVWIRRQARKAGMMKRRQPK